MMPSAIIKSRNNNTTSQFKTNRVRKQIKGQKCSWFRFRSFVVKTLLPALPFIVVKILTFQTLKILVYLRYKYTPLVDKIQMSGKELSNLFDRHEKSHGDFIRWSKAYGVSISRNTVSRHATGSRSIGSYAQIAYMVYFESLRIPPASATSAKASADGEST